MISIHALKPEQLKIFAEITGDMLTLIDTDEKYYTILMEIEQLPDSPASDLAKLGLIYLATERAKRFVASTN